MNKEKIKFRCWDEKEKRWYFYNEELLALAPEIQELNSVMKWDDMTLEQFTGLTDEKGKEIYEGDIVKAKTEDGEKILRCEWAEDCGRFEFNTEDMDEFYVYWESGHGSKDQIIELEVIGNFHDNPELFETDEE